MARWQISGLRLAAIQAPLREALHPRRVRILNRRANAYILGPSARFLWQVLKAFRANQGLLLAGAVAYYALLSIVPFLMLVVVVLSHFIDQDVLLTTLMRYLEWLVPGQSRSIIGRSQTFSRPPRPDHLGAGRDHGVFQFARLHRAGKGHERHLRAPGRSGAAIFWSRPSCLTATSWRWGRG